MLNPDETVILLGKRRSKVVLLGLHPEPGNYRVFLPPGHELEPGSRWDLSCPVCRQSLQSAIAPDLSALDMLTERAKHRVYFSCIAGEHATFVISAEGIERFGEHADRHSLEMLELV